MNPEENAPELRLPDEATQSARFCDYFSGERYDDLRRFVRAQCAEPVLAEEIVQDTVVRALAAWEKIKHFDNPMGWIVNTAKRIKTRAFSRVAAERERLRELEIVINEPFHEPMNDADAELLLLSMVNRLSKRESEVFSYHLARFTDQEIAQLLEISPSSVQSYRESARRRLQAMMDDGANGGCNENR